MNEIIYKSIFLRGGELKQGLLTAKESPIGFTPINSPEEWINTDRIYALWNIGYNLGYFGQEPVTGNLQIFFRLPKSRLALQLSSHGFMAGVGNGTGTLSGVRLIELKNGLHVIWHNELTCLRVDEWIYAAKAIARKHGKMMGGQIQFIEEAAEVIAEKLLNTDELFAVCSVAGPYDLQAKDEEIVKGFDKPELLTVISTEIGKFVTLTVRKESEESLINSRLAILKEQDIDINKLGEMQIADLIKLREKIVC